MLETWLIILGISLIFIGTILGSALVFLLKNKTSHKFNIFLMGTTAGVMLSASIFGLVVPSLNQAKGLGNFSVVLTLISVFVGAIILIFLDKFTQKFNKTTNNKKTFKLFIAITLHNIPEGLSVGLAFGFAISINQLAAYFSALSLAIGIALQNIPESLAVTLPIKQQKGKAKAFMFGALSGAVEPVFAIVGLLLASKVSILMPYVLAMSAGAMLLVTIEEVLPDANCEKSHWGGVWCVLGFVVMILLEMMF